MPLSGWVSNANECHDKGMGHKLVYREWEEVWESGWVGVICISWQLWPHFDQADKDWSLLCHFCQHDKEIGNHWSSSSHYTVALGHVLCNQNIGANIGTSGLQALQSLTLTAKLSGFVSGGSVLCCRMSMSCSANSEIWAAAWAGKPCKLWVWQLCCQVWFLAVCRGAVLCCSVDLLCSGAASSRCCRMGTFLKCKPATVPLIPRLAWGYFWNHVGSFAALCIVLQ